MARQRTKNKDLARTALDEELIHDEDERVRRQRSTDEHDDCMVEGFSLKADAEPVEPQFEPTHFAPVSYS